MTDKGVIADAHRITTREDSHRRAAPAGRARGSRAPRSAGSCARTSADRPHQGGMPRLDALVVSDYDKGRGHRRACRSRARRMPAPRKCPRWSSRRLRVCSPTAARRPSCATRKKRDFSSRESSATTKSIEEAGRALLAHFGCAAVVITLGEKGMSLFEEASPRHFHVPATSFEVSYARVGQPGVDRAATGRQVFDVTGAGDTVLAVLALAVAAARSAARGRGARQYRRRRRGRQTGHGDGHAGRTAGSRSRIPLKKLSRANSSCKPGLYGGKLID